MAATNWKFEVFKGANGQWYIRVRSTNGRIAIWLGWR